MIESIIGWYFVLGIITMVIGGYRNVKGKQSFDADELTALSWFLCWWGIVTILFCNSSSCIF